VLSGVAGVGGDCLISNLTSSASSSDAEGCCDMVNLSSSKGLYMLSLRQVRIWGGGRNWQVDVGSSDASMDPYEDGAIGALASMQSPNVGYSTNLEVMLQSVSDFSNCFMMVR
jgi:hypothetical protein